LTHRLPEVNARLQPSRACSAGHFAVQRAFSARALEVAVHQRVLADLVVVVRPVERWLCNSYAQSLSIRAQVIAGQAQAGQLHADRKAAWWRAFAAELASFPLGSADDQVDACAGALPLALEHLKHRRTLQLLLSQLVTVRRLAALTGGWQPRVST
jgi:hypothetical protein